MKRILNVILAALIFTFLSSVSKGQSSIDVGTGASIDLGTGANLDVDSHSGTFTGDGTINGSPLPVELTSFEAVIVDNSVHLTWETATEVNNYGFEIQRSAISGQRSEWETVGFVQGHGNSNSPKSYTFVDKNPINGTLQYRLKQIDNDGAFEYSAVVEVEINNLPTEFSLEQNYPNPFNPITTIEYSVPEAGIVNISVYNLLGEKVKEIVNSYKSAGVYKINFNPIHLSSGVYIYKMTAGSFTAVKKLNLIK